MNNEQLPIQDFYTIDDFAVRLKVHPQTVRRKIKCGQIAAFSFKGDKKSTYRIPHSEIQRLIENDLRNIFNL